MEWKGAPDWAIAEDQPWEVNGAPAGTVKQVGPLSFVRVAKAGHMWVAVGSHVCMCMHACTRACSNELLQASWCVCMCVYVLITCKTFELACVHVSVRVCVYVQATHTHTHTHAHTHTHTHAHTHTHSKSRVLLPVRAPRVPMDQPLNALAMITSWTRNATLARPHHITPLEGEGARSCSHHTALTWRGREHAHTTPR